MDIIIHNAAFEWSHTFYMQIANYKYLLVFHIRSTMASESAIVQVSSHM